MSYVVRLSRQADGYLDRLSRTDQQRIVRRLDKLAESPYLFSKALRDLGGHRAARVGGWRSIFSVDEERGQVLVQRIAPRGQAYRGL